MSQEVIALTKEHNYGTWRKQKGWNPNHLVSADGCYFTDGNGKKYLDFSSQLMCMNLGHNNQAVIESIAEQAKTLAYAAPFYATTARGLWGLAYSPPVPAAPRCRWRPSHT